MIKIAVWNLKGGTGKTTFSFNVAAQLARVGKRVLTLDLDMQANLTSFYEKDIEKRANRPDIAEIITNGLELKKGIYKSKYENLSFVKGGNSCVRNIDSVDVLADMLNKENDSFDYCVIDCHPDCMEVTENALFAADLVIVPINLNGFSRDNLNLVTTELDYIETLTQKDIKRSIVVNRLKKTVTQREIYMDLVQNHDYEIYENCISEFEGFNRALSLHKPLYMHRSTSDACKDIENLTQEIVSGLEVM